MNLAHIVREEAPKIDENPVTKETMLTIDAWKNTEFFLQELYLEQMG